MASGSVTAKDRTRILNLLNQATSSNENEALLSLRIANKMLADRKLDWHGFFDARVVAEEPRRSRPTDPRPPRYNYSWSQDNPNSYHYKHRTEYKGEWRDEEPKKEPDEGEDEFVKNCNSARDKIKQMLHFCISRTKKYTSKRKFIESLDEFFMERGHLTPKQLAALENYYNELYRGY